MYVTQLNTGYWYILAYTQLQFNRREIWRKFIRHPAQDRSYDTRAEAETALSQLRFDIGDWPHYLHSFDAHLQEAR